MTREEAIKVLKVAVAEVEWEYPMDYAAAFDLAIEALEQEPCDDLISRKAAIDAIAECTNCGDEDTLRAYVLKHNLDNGWTGGILEALDAVKDLPSAQPQYTELTPEEAASEIASGSIMSASYWLDAMIRLKQMEYAICRKKG